MATGEHVQVVMLPGELQPDLARRVATEALAVAESAWLTVATLTKAVPTERVVLTLHGDEQAFRKIERLVRGDSLPLAVAVSPTGEQAHVLLRPLGSRVIERFGLPSSTKQDIVYALAKQCMSAKLGARSDDWISDVLALGVLEEHVNPKWQLGVDILFDSRREQFARAKQWQVMQLDQVLRDHLAATPWAHRERTNDRAILAEQLARKSRAWARTLLRSWRGGDDPVKARQTAVESVLGRNWTKTQEQFEKMMPKMKPEWTCSPEVWREADTWHLVGTKSDQAHLFRETALPEGDYRIRMSADVEVRDEAKDFRVLLDWDGLDSLGIFLLSDRVRIRRFRQGWFDVVEADTKLTPGKWMDLRIDYVDGTLTLHVDGRLIITHRPERGMHGLWGVASGEAVARLRNIEVEALPAASAGKAKLM